MTILCVGDWHDVKASLYTNFWCTTVPIKKIVVWWLKSLKIRVRSWRCGFDSSNDLDNLTFFFSNVQILWNFSGIKKHAFGLKHWQPLRLGGPEICHWAYLQEFGLCLQSLGPRTWHLRYLKDYFIIYPTIGNEQHNINPSLYPYEQK